MTFGGQTINTLMACSNIQVLGQLTLLTSRTEKGAPCAPQLQEKKGKKTADGVASSSKNTVIGAIHLSLGWE